MSNKKPSSDDAAPQTGDAKDAADRGEQPETRPEIPPEQRETGTEDAADESLTQPGPDTPDRSDTSAEERPDEAKSVAPEDGAQDVAENPEKPAESELPTPEDTGGAQPVHQQDEPPADPTMPDHESEPPADPVAGTQHREPANPPARRGGGAWALLLGGAVVAALGFAAGNYAIPDPRLDALRGDLSDQQQAVSALRDTVAELQQRDPAPQDGRVDDLADTIEAADARTDTVSQSVDDLKSRLSALSDRLEAVENRPIPAPDSGEADAASRAELAALREALAAQREEIDKLAEKAAQREAAAEVTAQHAMTRAALSRIDAALDAGTGFAPALADLRAAGVDVSGDLVAVAEDGVETYSSLQSRFPDLAREALAAARSTGADGPQGDVMAFLRAQLGLRSLEPRPGDDPDAVLSRAEAALRDGRLTDTLAEIEQLPEPARVVLSDWVGDVVARRNAVAAAEALAQELNSN
ncbi:hypothetical protein [Sediminimonas sp.]|uniref:hypothetical protein n=1 Tax=Sediminimonas sp. TaxID=2823379 RepID=UPI0025F955F9|nr:hypothetical protein [Sediminimonas sp.]